MTKKSIVDTVKVRARAFEILKSYGWTKLPYKIESGAIISDTEKNVWRQCYNAAYNEERKKLKSKSIDFWLTMSGGAVEKILNNNGLIVTKDRRIQFHDNASLVLEFWLKEKVIPELEKLGIKGIKIPKRVSGQVQNVMDFSEVEFNAEEIADAIIKNEEEQKVQN